MAADDWLLCDGGATSPCESLFNALPPLNELGRGAVERTLTLRRRESLADGRTLTTRSVLQARRSPPPPPATPTVSLFALDGRASWAKPPRSAAKPSSRGGTRERRHTRRPSRRQRSGSARRSGSASPSVGRGRGATRLPERVSPPKPTPLATPAAADSSHYATVWSEGHGVVSSAPPPMLIHSEPRSATVPSASSSSAGLSGDSTSLPSLPTVDTSPPSRRRHLRRVDGQQTLSGEATVPDERGWRRRLWAPSCTNWAAFVLGFLFSYVYDSFGNWLCAYLCTQPY